MTVSTDAIRFPTSDTPLSSTHTDYRDSTVTRAAMTAHDAVDRVAGAVGPMVDKVKDTASRATNLFQTRDFSEFQEQSLASLRVAVRKRPATSVAVALAVGWVVGRALTR